MPRRPSDVVVDRDTRAMPMLAGTTRNEGTLFTTAFYDRAGTPLTDTWFRTLLSAAAGSRASAAGRAYSTVDRTPGQAWSDVITDRGYACTALTTYRLLGPRAPLYAYEFADPSAPSPFTVLPPDVANGVTHGAEMPYLFDLVPGQPTLTPAQQELADEMVQRWAQFAATGDPGDPAWPRWSGDGEILSITGAGPGSTARPAAEFAAAHQCDLWAVG